MDQEGQRAWAERTIRVVNAALPEASALTGENRLLSSVSRPAQQALTIREKTLEPDHPDIIRSRRNLGVIYRHWGKYELVKPLLQSALNSSEQALGFDHLDTLVIIINLAQLYSVRRVQAG